jgi:hypothetical protein
LIENPSEEEEEKEEKEEDSERGYDEDEMVYSLRNSTSLSRREDLTKEK